MGKKSGRRRPNMKTTDKDREINRREKERKRERNIAWSTTTQSHRESRLELLKETRAAAPIPWRTLCIEYRTVRGL